MKHQIRRIRVLSVAKIAFFIYWALGIVMALIYGAFFGMLSVLDPGQIDPELGGMTRLLGGLGAVLVLVLGLFGSIIYGVLAALVVSLGCVGYNLLARMIGGVELDIVPADPPDSAATSVPQSRIAPPIDTVPEVVWTPIPRPLSSEDSPPPIPLEERPHRASSEEPAYPSSSEDVPRPASSESSDPDSRWRPPAGE